MNLGLIFLLLHSTVCKYEISCSSTSSSSSSQDSIVASWVTARFLRDWLNKKMKKSKIIPLSLPVKKFYHHVIGNRHFFSALMAQNLSSENGAPINQRLLHGKWKRRCLMVARVMTWPMDAIMFERWEIRKKWKCRNDVEGNIKTGWSLDRWKCNISSVYSSN